MYASVFALPTAGVPEIVKVLSADSAFSPSGRVPEADQVTSSPLVTVIVCEVIAVPSVPVIVRVVGETTGVSTFSTAPIDGGSFLVLPSWSVVTVSSFVPLPASPLSASLSSIL